eukprot:scaffold52701_cov55-Attheya_sp.AAC.1
MPMDRVVPLLERFEGQPFFLSHGGRGFLGYFLVVPIICRKVCHADDRRSPIPVQFEQILLMGRMDLRGAIKPPRTFVMTNTTRSLLIAIRPSSIDTG